MESIEDPEIIAGSLQIQTSRTTVDQAWPIVAFFVGIEDPVKIEDLKIDLKNQTIPESGQ